MELAILIAESGEKMNLSLLQHPKRVKKGTKSLYIYTPSVVSLNVNMDAGTPIKILDVFDHEEPEDTILKVMPCKEWERHTAIYNVSDTQPQCTRYTRALNVDPLCACELELDEMPKYIKDNVYYVLITDIGK
jgi:hypothetical protein